MHKSVRRQGREPKVAASIMDKLCRRKQLRIQKMMSMRMTTTLPWPLMKRPQRVVNGVRLATYRMCILKKLKLLSLQMYQRYRLLHFEPVIIKWNYVLQGVYFEVLEKTSIVLTSCPLLEQLSLEYSYLFHFWVTWVWIGIPKTTSRILTMV